MRLFFPILLLLALTAPTAADQEGAPDANLGRGWSALPPLPDATGVAGPFAGVSGDALLVAGGANFPDAPPWAGGMKVWHDAVYVLDGPDGTWRVAGKLPRPAAYGVSVIHGDAVICIGGSDADRHHAEVFRLRWDGKTLTTEALPSLPRPLANACGAIIGSTIYIAGGTQTPTSTTALNDFYALDLADPAPTWKALPPVPGDGRMLAVAAAQEGSFFIFSGASLTADEQGKPVRKYLTDGYRYRPGAGWSRLADMPRPAVAAPSPAPAVGAAHVLILGGDDGTNAGFQPPDAHPGFPPDVLAYHTITDTWAMMGESPAPRVTVPVTSWHGNFVIPSGEMRPGVRSPQVFTFHPQSPPRHFGWLNYLTLAAYPLIMLAIAYRVGSKHTSDEFFRGSQRIPWWAAGLSIYATMLSSITFMAIPGKSYVTDWSFMLANLSVPILAPLVIAVYLPFYRQLNITSAYEYLEKRFNLVARWFGSASFIVLQLGRTAIVLYLPALALATVSNFDMTLCVLIMGGISILMTFQGGLESVVWTDVAQTIILLAGALITLAVAAHGVGGFDELFAVATADQKLFGELSWSWDLTIASGWVILIGNLFSSLASYTASQDVVQRFVSTRNTKQAAKSIWTNAIMVIPSTLLFFIVGTALYVFYKMHPGQLDPTLKNDAVFPLFIINELPAGLGGLVVAGIFAAAQPTSSLNSIATAYVTDFHARLRPATPDATKLKLGKIVTVLSGVLGTALALAMTQFKIASAWDTFLGLLGLTGSALAGLFALGIFSRRANGRGAVVGAAAAVTALLLVRRFTNLHFFTYGVIGVVTTVTVGWLASLVLPAQPKPLDGLTVHTMRKPEEVEEPCP